MEKYTLKIQFKLVKNLKEGYYFLLWLWFLCLYLELAKLKTEHQGNLYIFTTLKKKIFPARFKKKIFIQMKVFFCKYKKGQKNPNGHDTLIIWPIFVLFYFFKQHINQKKIKPQYLYMKPIFFPKRFKAICN